MQRASFRALQDAITQAGEVLKTDCPTYRPITPVVRIDAMEQRVDAMLRAINIVQPALQKFYSSLTAAKLALFLMDPHPKMPNMQLSRTEAADLAAYIATLK